MDSIKRKSVKRILTYQCHLKGIDNRNIEFALAHTFLLYELGKHSSVCILSGIGIAEQLQKSPINYAL